MSNNLPATVSGTTTMGESFYTPLHAAVRNLHLWVTAGGANDLVVALGYLDEGPTANLEQMAAAGWVTHELVVTDWDNIASRVHTLLTGGMGGE